MKYLKTLTILIQINVVLLIAIKGLVPYTLSPIISYNFTKCDLLFRPVSISYLFITYIYSSLCYLY
jgi:hypothetical protein